MLNKCKNKIILVSGIFFIFISLGYLKYQKDMKLVSVLHDYNSWSILYAINTNNISASKAILISNLTNLISNYDKELFSESKRLSKICRQWNNGLKEIVIADINQSEYKDTPYQQQVLTNIKLLENDCD